MKTKQNQFQIISAVFVVSILLFGPNYDSLTVDYSPDNSSCSGMSGQPCGMDSTSEMSSTCAMTATTASDDNFQYSTQTLDYEFVDDISFGGRRIGCRCIGAYCNKVICPGPCQVMNFCGVPYYGCEYSYCHCEAQCSIFQQDPCNDQGSGCNCDGDGCSCSGTYCKNNDFGPCGGDRNCQCGGWPCSCPDKCKDASDPCSGNCSCDDDCDCCPDESCSSMSCMCGGEGCGISGCDGTHCDNMNCPQGDCPGDK
ncbi:MAG: hypothetical protein ACXAC2_10570 [Candidatus Kariarchaeaceae archaeon]